MRCALCACGEVKTARKLHAIVNVLTMEPHRVVLSHAAAHDKLGFAGVRTSSAKERCFSSIWGYCDFERFAPIDAAGGFLISHAKSGFNSRVVRDLGAGPGRRTPIAGLKLKQALGRRQRAALDVLVELK